MRVTGMQRGRKEEQKGWEKGTLAGSVAEREIGWLDGLVGRVDGIVHRENGCCYTMVVEVTACERNCLVRCYKEGRMRKVAGRKQKAGLLKKTFCQWVHTGRYCICSGFPWPHLLGVVQHRKPYPLRYVASLALFIKKQNYSLT